MANRSIFFVNVGDLPPAKAVAYVEEAIKRHKKNKFLNKGERALYFPQHEGTDVIVIPD